MASIGIVGAGLAGLAAGITLKELGHSVTIYEASDTPGGRVRSFTIDGHIIDAGFQIYIDGYPAGQRLLDYPSLDLKSFSPGSTIHNFDNTFKIGDPLRSPTSTLRTSLSKVGTLSDKLTLLKLRKDLKKLSVSELWERPDITALDFLDGYGFSPKFIENFWRPLFSGITLDPQLSGSANTLQFVFKMLASSNAVVPSKGMAQIPLQLSQKLKGSILLNHTVTEVSNQCIKTGDHSEHFDGVIVATDRDIAHSLCKIPNPVHSSSPESIHQGWKSCVSIWFGADKAPTKDTNIHLGVNSPVNNFAVISNVSSAYAPAGKTTMVATTTGINTTEDDMRQALNGWFGDQVNGWRTLEVQQIPKAQPKIQVSAERKLAKRVSGDIILAGDHLADASINGALESGEAAAKLCVQGLVT